MDLRQPCRKNYTASVIIGLTTARAIWQALEAEYCNASVERVHNIRDKLRSLVKGSGYVAEFGLKFKGLCDQLSAIGHTVSDTDKLYWFTVGLGVDYISFTSNVRATRPTNSFQDLIAQAESHEVLLCELQGQNTPTATFVAQSSRSPRRGHGGRGYNRGYRNYRGGRNNCGGRENNGPRNNNRDSPSAPHPCQLCGLHGHVASSCPSHVSYPTSEAHLANSFQAQCQVNPNNASWYVGSGATDHTTQSTGNILDIISCNGKDKDWETRQVLAQGQCENGLYVLNQEHQALSAVSTNKASYELW
ncbi:uncharacterized protein LOC143567496 [Bidens hawaiensis]|uniref:uncharacterized protein LOC143567496 n=1 Tax=Bidens hawaiensis TaxID=980011 RepID=UPI00404B2A1C